VSISAQAEISAGQFWQQRISHGPTARIGYENVSIDGYSEHGNTSTAMTFGAQTRKGMVAQIGYQFTARYGQFKPYVQIGYELNDTASDGISARLNSANSSFDTAGSRLQNGGKMQIGTTYRLNSRLQLHTQLQKTFEQTNGREWSANIGIQGQF
jgi:outer membrane lipase/esterase